MTRNEAKRIRANIEKAATFADDQTALESAWMYPSWEKCVSLGSVESEEGFRFVHEGKLYKCRNANPVFQDNWIPGVGTESLYKRIDETHAGTAGDPIPYDGNMELVEGKYYTQNGVVYLCTRSTGTAVYHALSDLVGIYVEAVANQQ